MGRAPEESLGAYDGTGYRFLVGGHTYGRHDAPAEGLFEPLLELWRRPEVREGARFAVLCGDVVINPHPKNFEKLDDDLAVLGLAVFLAPGNHDTLKPQLPDVITLRYGGRRLAFRHGPDAFLVGDTPRGGGNLAPEDLADLKRLLKGRPRALFIFLHHLIWVDEGKVARGEVEEDAVNGLVGYAREGNFDDVVLPLLGEANTRVFIFAGDLGAGSRAVQTFETRGDNVTLVAGGMGEHSEVGVYHSVWVFSNGVEIEVVWLEGGKREKHWVEF